MVPRSAPAGVEVELAGEITRLPFHNEDLDADEPVQGWRDSAPACMPPPHN